MQLIKAKFLKGEIPSGRDYTYCTPEVVGIGDLVQINESSKGIVTGIDIPESEVEAFKDKLKTIIGKAEIKKITISEVATTLDRIQYAYEYSKIVALSDKCKDAGIVIVYGASDDLMEFEGALYDEIGVYDGGEAYVSKSGLNVDDGRNVGAFLGHLITANWDREGYSWIYETDIPHKTFDIMEDDEKYCRGIVFSLNNLENGGNE